LSTCTPHHSGCQNKASFFFSSFIPYASSILVRRQ
jgi:hypothetical protein